LNVDAFGFWNPHYLGTPGDRLYERGWGQGNGERRRQEMLVKMLRKLQDGKGSDQSYQECSGDAPQEPAMAAS
jgi:hypothetical protein